MEIETDDYYSTFITLGGNIVGNVVIDLLNKKAERTLKIIGTKGTLSWNWLNTELSVYSSDRLKRFNLKKERNYKKYNASEEMYKEELRAFLMATTKRAIYEYDYYEDYQNLKLVEKFIGN